MSGLLTIIISFVLALMYLRRVLTREGREHVAQAEERQHREGGDEGGEREALERSH